MRRTSVVCVLLACVALSVSHAQVSVTGTGNVGVGRMSGGTINIGTTKAQLEATLKAAVKASGAEQARLMRKLASDLNAAAAKLSAHSSGNPPFDDFNATIVHGFLATVVGKKVPEGDWPRVFNELANRFLETGSRIAATPVTSNTIKALVASAEAARKAGDFDKADAQLELAEKQAINDAADRKEKWRESNRQAANLLAARGSLALTRLERRKAAELLQRAFEQVSDEINWESFWWLLDSGDSWLQLGESMVALAVVERARDAAYALVLRYPDDAQWLRDLSVSQNKIGDIKRAQGDFPAALKSYRASMTIRQKLVALNPEIVMRQRDLSVSHNKIGNVEQQSGNLASALESYHADMLVAEKLAATDLGNLGFQRDLSVSHNNVGDIEQAQGNLDAAYKSYQASMLIRERLVATKASNAEWQCDLSVSHSKIGDIERKRGNGSSAVNSYQAGMQILKRLVLIDPGNTEWQRYLSFSYHNIGSVEQLRGNPSEAFKSFRADMQISEMLAGVDPRNAEWQMDFALSCWKIGNLEVAGLGKNERQALLVRGLRALQDLEKQGRLAPRAAGWPAMFRQAITDLK